MSTHHTPTRPDAASPWVFSTRELGRRPGNMRTVARTVPAPDAPEVIGLENVIVVPAGSPVELDLQLESVTEGVYVSGTAAAGLTGECSRCLDPLTETVEVEIAELFAYPDSVTEETTDEDEIPRLVDERIDIEQVVRDAVVLALPLAPLCDPDCLGLCAECGGRRADLGPDHGHETLDPRWAALRERLPSAD
ncbi:YceD family protein [Pseudonocardia sp. H11422]|uniref:YceD family protein n=1 Tax=Pseudonocardia sp. H11422 TaxID=2835866 RepID=UPI001BDBD9BF|nr:YceD family protein [Pseudonocardia sp. H11422]